jgi:hypothetical protein
MKTLLVCSESIKPEIGRFQAAVLDDTDYQILKIENN